VLRQVADEYLRAEGRIPELGVGEPKIVDPLRDMVGKLVGKCKADTERLAVVADHIDAGNFRFLARVGREGGRHERRARCNGHEAVPLVEPLRLHALFARCRLSAFQAHAKHLHGIGKLLLLRIELFVHGVPRGGGPKMRQSSSRQVKMRRIRMAYRRKQPPASVNRIQIDNLAKTLPLDQCLQPGSRAASFHRQRIDARRAIYDARLAAIAGYHPNGVGIVEYLRNEHSVTSLVSRRSPCTNSGSDGTTPPSAPSAFPRPLSRRGVKSSRIDNPAAKAA